MFAAVLLLLLEAWQGNSEFRSVRKCAECHANEAKPQPATSMAHALELVSECAILRNHPALTFKEGVYTFRIERRGEESIYTVAGNGQTVSVPIKWAFGLGSAGQTYVFEKDGEMYQTRVSYFREIDGLDLTLGAQNIKPANIKDALGMPMSRDEKVACFNCHSTNSSQAMQLTLQRMTPGVQCERCHGRTDAHLEGLRRGDSKLAQMRSLKTLTSEETSNFCGQCHRTWEQVAVQGKLGVVDVRFQPYRLTNSKCYDADDARIKCVACHNPHQEISHTISGYDSRCLACHSGGQPRVKVCKVSSEKCASCHMPKIEIPGSHHQFTDHQIRIVRANESYPD